jgi:hypothetical protein
MIVVSQVPTSACLKKRSLRNHAHAYRFTIDRQDYADIVSLFADKELTINPVEGLMELIKLGILTIAPFRDFDGTVLYGLRNREGKPDDVEWLDLPGAERPDELILKMAWWRGPAPHNQHMPALEAAPRSQAMPSNGTAGKRKDARTGPRRDRQLQTGLDRHDD